MAGADALHIQEDWHTSMSQGSVDLCLREQYTTTRYQCACLLQKTVKICPRVRSLSMKWPCMSQRKVNICTRARTDIRPLGVNMHAQIIIRSHNAIVYSQNKIPPCYTDSSCIVEIQTHVYHAHPFIRGFFPKLSEEPILN